MKTILFLCVANSARSQVVEGLARRLASDGVRVVSPDPIWSWPESTMLLGW